MDTIVRLFRRETVSIDFIPAVDGLRFLAILMVVLFHIDAYLREAAGVASDAYPVFNFMTAGHQGVQLFFIVSGFVLAIPFIRQAYDPSKQVSLRKYFLRRLTRLEPPYIICLLALFLIQLFVVSHAYPLSDLVLSLVSSLAYVSNFVFPGELPHISSVTWSLEIEVQFYILAPFLTGAICLVRSRIRRRLGLLILIVITAALSWYLVTVLQVQTRSLAWYLQYFLAGVLICDIFLLDPEWLKKLNGALYTVAGVFLLVSIVSFDHSNSPDLLIKVASPLMMSALFLIVLGNGAWGRIFSITPLTLIGGMCYSIYLLHWITIVTTGRFTSGLLAGSGYLAYFAVHAVVFMTAVIIVAGGFFLLVEKPCMKRDWYQKLGQKVRRLLGMAGEQTREQST